MNKVINWSILYEKYKGKWIALADDEKTVVAVAENAKEVLEKAQKAGYPQPILTKMPQKLLTYVGSGV